MIIFQSGVRFKEIIFSQENPFFAATKRFLHALFPGNP